MNWARGTEEIRALIDDTRLLRLLDYWQAKGSAGRLPGRADIDPLDMSYLLGNLLLVDVQHDPPRYSYRLVGTNLTSYIGLDLTGQAVDRHPDPTFRAAALKTYGEIARSGEPRAVRRDAMMDGRLRRYQVIMLPLAADGHTVDMVLAAYAFAAEDRPKSSPPVSSPSPRIP